MIRRCGQHKGFRLDRRDYSALLISIFMLLFTGAGLAQETAEQIDPIAVFNQAQDLHEKGDLAGAIRLYEKAIKVEPSFPEAYYQRGVAELAMKFPADAERSFRRALELRGDWPPPLTSLGSLLLDRGDATEADKLLSRAVELEPQNSSALIALTELKLNSRSSARTLEGLLALIVKLTDKANTTASLWSARAALENALAKRRAARGSVAKALLLDIKHRQSLILSAEIAVSDGDLATAKDVVSRLSELFPNSDESKLLRARIFAAEGFLDEASKQLGSLTKPSSATSELSSRISQYRTTGVADLEKQLEKSPKDGFILGRLCVLYRLINPEKALSFCRQASEAEPENVTHAVGFGAALVQGKQFESAVALFTKILELVPDNLTARANLASAFFQLKRYPEARSSFELLTEAQPKSAGAYFFLGIIHDETGSYMDAMANYQMYLKLADPVQNKLEIEKINLRLPPLQKLIKEGKGKKK